jgi:hypothetical protein
LVQGGHKETERCNSLNEGGGEVEDERKKIRKKRGKRNIFISLKLRNFGS